MIDRTVLYAQRGYLLICVYFTVGLPLLLPDIVNLNVRYITREGGPNG